MSSGTSSTRELGNYELLAKIAEGGMGAVFKARHKVSRLIYALKVIPSDTARHPVLLRRFEQEFRAASLIDHPNVVRAIEYCGAMPTPFLVMEFVDGKSLGDLVEESGPVGEESALQIIAQVCEGLHRAHKQGLIHRDVKPDNILLTADGVAKLTDLGLVKDVDGDDNLTKTGKGLGTPHFMAPEQFRNAKHADVRCDVYSLGATLFTLVTGQIPFAGTNALDCWIRKSRNEFPPPKALAPHLSDRTDFAIRRAMTANPADRPASCREFMEDLTGVAWRPGQGGPGDSSLIASADGNTVWYMVLYDEIGVPKTVKGTTDTIRRNIQAGTLGDPAQVLVCRTKAGPFSPLRSVPEFRDLILEDSLSADGSASGLRSPTASGSSSGASRGRLTPASKSRMSPPSSGRLGDTGPRSGRRATVPSVKDPTPNPAPPSDVHRALGDITDVCSAVPLTDESTLHLESAERPRLSTNVELTEAPAPPPASSPTLVIVAGLSAALAAIALAAFLLTR
jgi:eukaryotic-like serine/threonine-protein kinase